VTGMDGLTKSGPRLEDSAPCMFGEGRRKKQHYSFRAKGKGRGAKRKLRIEEKPEKSSGAYAVRAGREGDFHRLQSRTQLGTGGGGQK